MIYQLFRLGHGLNRKLFVYQRVFWVMIYWKLGLGAMEPCCISDHQQSTKIFTNEWFIIPINGLMDYKNYQPFYTKHGAANT